MDQTAEKLNRLLRAEQDGVLQHVAGPGSFVARTAVADRALVERMLADEREHQRALSEMILRRRGTPCPPLAPIESGTLHYLGLDHLMPHVIADKQRLVNVYQEIGAMGDAGADDLVRELLADHAAHLGELERLHANLFQPR